MVRTTAPLARGGRVGPGSVRLHLLLPVPTARGQLFPHRGPAWPPALQADFPPPTSSRPQKEKTIHFNAIGAAAVLRRLPLRLWRVRFSPWLARQLCGLLIRAVVASGTGHLGLVGVRHPAATASASAACAEGLRARQWRRPGKR